MALTDFTNLTDEQFLYLTTTGRVTGLPREIEIWYVFDGGKFYVLAEHFHQAQWVKNIQRQPQVRVRIAGRTFEAIARVLDEAEDAAAWQTAQRLGREKYGWGDGLPVELTLISPIDDDAG